MSHVLCDANLLDGSLPASWAPALAQLHALDDLGQRAAREGASAAHRAEASTLRAALLAEVARLDEPLPASLQPGQPELRRWFAEAVLLFGSFAEAGGELLIDTVGEASLAGYPLDYVPTDASRARIRRALRELNGWSEEQLAEVERKLARVSANLRVKQAIGRALAALVRELGAGDDKHGALSLMQALYGTLPWRAGDVDLVLTTTAVFLCVPYQGTALGRPGYGERPEVERGEISAFLQRVEAARQSIKSVRFPAFGLFDPAAIAPWFMPRLVADVRAHEGLSQIHERVVTDTLATMVSVLPTHELAKYLVHDAYGHGWQESLCDFEWTFQDMPRLVEPLQPNGGSFCSAGTRLGAGFEAREGRTVLRRDELLRVVEADLRGRIRVGINLVISEALADLVEHKLARAGRPLPSSSLLPQCPLRLDLSIMDARSMVRAYRRPYRALGKPEERARFCAELVALGLPEDGCEQAVSEAHALIQQHFSSAFTDATEIAPADQTRVAASVMQRILLGAAGFDAAVERFLQRADAHDRTLGPPAADRPRYERPAGCSDLLVLLLAWFYEQERALHVWHLDELLNGTLFPALLELETALAREPG